MFTPDLRPPAAEPPVAPRPPAALPRRDFLALVTGTLACGGACREMRASTDRPVDVGRIEDYPRDGISEKYIQYDLFVVRHEGRLYACTAICPHKANLLLLDPKQADRIICSGHESTFDLAGINRGGPARRALDRFGIAVNAQGRIIVDTAKTFRQPQWEDPASFVKLG
jgi:nitrite reductase/ring-hydroxylating ferredoxin subunit